MQTHWHSFLTQNPLIILTDLDGSILPLSSGQEDHLPPPGLIALLSKLARLPNVYLGIVSSRSRSDLDYLFDVVQGVNIFAEHGLWQRCDGEWTTSLCFRDQPMEDLAVALESLIEGQLGAFVERKTWSVALHYRRVQASERPAILVHAAAIIDRWLQSHRQFECLDATGLIEVRVSHAGKENAVACALKEVGADAKILAIGNDPTDEDMFEALRSGDAGVIVSLEPVRPTSARWLLHSSAEVTDFLASVLALRAYGEPLAAHRCPQLLRKIHAGSRLVDYDLLVVSNRLPELRSAATGGRTRNVGGLVAALQPVMSLHRGMWLGWSGRTVASEHTAGIGFDQANDPPVAWLDFPESWHRGYYQGFCNRTLWPLFHSFPERFRIEHADWQTYVEVNAAFAQAAGALVASTAMVWVHDYHLLMFGRCLRRMGHTGPIGLFLHIPFPSRDMFMLLPWAKEILLAMLDFDLIGFHTDEFVANFMQCLTCLDHVEISGSFVKVGARLVEIKAFPIGIIPETFQDKDLAAADDVSSLKRAINSCHLILGVDRLDYTKGIPERIKAFGLLLEHFPEWRRKVALVQISVPSRADIADYEEQRSRVEEVVGRINGQFGDTDWVPIRYLYRSYSQAQLSELYRAARVGYVTPLRDGMNLVAKEYVAAQDAADPGVLVLSQFAGAAAELKAAVLCNPWDVEGMAKALDMALRLDLAQRRWRHKSLHALVCKTTATSWARDFLQTLATGAGGHDPAQVARALATVMCQSGELDAFG